MFETNSFRAAALILATASAGFAQTPVTIRVDAAKTIGPFKPIYAWFGHDEPNYAYTKNGRKLVGELAALSAAPVYMRTHFLLATGNGEPGLKWGSTNAYTEDAAGRPVYDWAIVDRIFDTWLSAGAKPYVEIGFMPEALSSKPEPYKPTWIPGAKNEQYSIGWTYPPKDYAKWGELVYQWVRHAIGKYGREQVESWYWEVWNEPDISYWHGTPEEYDHLYDVASAAVKRADPRARVGGPASTGPAGAKAAAFLRQFLEHCAQTGAPLDFVSFHAKGAPVVTGDHISMGISKEARDVDTGFKIVRSFPKFANLPIVLSEADPEGCAACSARVYPRNAYRNGALYPAYTAAMLKNILELADREKANIAGMLTWAFEFENQPYFDGFRTLATNGIDKPILNLFRMAGLMTGERIHVESSGRVPVEEMMARGVRNAADIDGLAVRSETRVSLLAWNYHDEDIGSAPAQVQTNFAGLPSGVHRVLVRHYRIDASHSNAYTVWKSMGSPQNPSPEQYAALERAGQLQLLDSPHWITASGGEVKLDFALPRQAVSLIDIQW